MALQELKLASLADFEDGRVAAVFDRHLRAAIADCEDRPSDKKPRLVTLTLAVLPVTLQDGSLVDVAIEARAAGKIPPHRSRTVACSVKHGGRVLFNGLSPDDPHQRTIDEIEG